MLDALSLGDKISLGYDSNLVKIFLRLYVEIK